MSERIPERILCAAIWFNDGKKHEHQPKNIETGFVVTGRRHHNCYATLAAIGEALDIKERALRAFERIDRDSQGFITSSDRYVDRKEGLQIALSNKQVYHNMHDKATEEDILISEDLY